MKCHDIVEMLDSHALPGTNAARRATVDQHLATCESCSDHRRAQQALARQGVPRVRPELLVETRRLVAARLAAPRSRRFSWRLVLGGSVLAGGAALAALGIMTQSERLTGDAVSAARTSQASAAMAAGEAPAQSGDALATAAEAPETAPGASVVSGPDAGQRAMLPDGDYFPLLKVAPRYPAEAAESGLEGSVVVEFTVTADGTVDEIMVVESTDPVFESAAVSAVEEFKYMPRVVSGESVPVPGVRNKITFVLDGAPVDPEVLRKHALLVVQDPSMRPSFWEIVAPGLEGCVDAGNWSCAELVLDEANATYDFNPAEERALWKFYGYIFTKYEDYERAIAAYEKALTQPIYAEDTTRLTLAHLYFGRQQYAQALDAALEYIETAPNPVPGAFQFVDTLRQLGITKTP